MSISNKKASAAGQPPLILKILIGSSRPNTRFWLTQYAFLIITMFVAPLALMFSAFYIAGKLNIGRSGWVLIPITLYIVPIFGWIFHMVAAFRAANLAETKSMKIFCRFYPLVFAVASLYALFHFSISAVREREFKGRQSDAKIGLINIHEAQKFFFSKSGKYAENESQLGSDPAEQLGYYRFAIITCKDSRRANAFILKHVGRYPDGKEAVLVSWLEKWTQSESCEGRKNGFTAFAAGNQNFDEVDGWRINERKELLNFQKRE